MPTLATLRARVTSYNNLVVISGRGFISGLNQSMIGVVFQPFVLSLGASMSQLGFLASLGGFGGLMPTLVAPWGGWLADQRGRKSVLLGASGLAIAAYILYSVAGSSNLLWVLYPAIVVLGASQIAQPANSALVGESVKAGRRGSAYSVYMLAVTLPGIFAPVVAGTLADRFGYRIVFPIVMLCEGVSLVLVARYLIERRRTGAQIGWRGGIALFRRAWLPPPDLRWFFIANALDMFSWGMGFGLLYGLLTREYGFSAAQLGILSSVSNLTWAVTALPVGRIIDRVGTRLVLIASEGLGPPLMLIWMTQTRFEIFAASMALFALTAATWVPARNTYVSHAVEPARRGEIFGRVAAFSGLIAFPSSFLGGFLYDHYGFAAPFLGNLVGALVTMLVLLLFVREAPPAPAAQSAGIV